MKTIKGNGLSVFNCKSKSISVISVLMTSSYGIGVRTFRH
ncbi:hypothetical protein M5D96_001930 [Drosophila gunungcola]|uniref:Uncharacterized protein n=1 Tax=Drosophila gunungcola TaxID=103775 RepID=A0A9P9YZ16_9MUSC|nr:hypothetical protein M5D96_001930 [Drosophila gunungcola]